MSASNSETTVLFSCKEFCFVSLLACLFVFRHACFFCFTLFRQQALQLVSGEFNDEFFAGGDVRMGDIVLLVDSDTRIPEDCLSKSSGERAADGIKRPYRASDGSSGILYSAGMPYAPANNTGTVAATGSIPHTATLVIPICATRFQRYYIGQPAL